MGMIEKMNKISIFTSHSDVPNAPSVEETFFFSFFLFEEFPLKRWKG